jgi:hypothetical protein
MPHNLFPSNPIPPKAKKLGLLSIYKFSLGGIDERINYQRMRGGARGCKYGNEKAKVLYRPHTVMLNRPLSSAT